MITVGPADDKAAYHLWKATEAPDPSERANGRRWLRRNGYGDLVPARDPSPSRPHGEKPAPQSRAGTHEVSQPAPVCRVHDHLDRRCDCFSPSNTAMRTAAAAPITPHDGQPVPRRMSLRPAGRRYTK